MPLVNIVLLVDLEILRKVDPRPSSVINIRGKVLSCRCLIEKVFFLVTEEPDYTIVEFDEVLLKVALIDNGAAVF
jgi:hypothetical protein